MTIYSLDVLLSQFVNSPLFHMQFYLLLPDLQRDSSGGRSGGLVYPSLSVYISTVIHKVKGFGIIKEAEVDVFL